MRTASTPIIALLATLVLAAGFVVFGGCESNPAEPVYDNPWDPDGPDGGDALQVRATAQDTVINVTWNQPQGQGIVLYVVSHTLDTGGDWEELGEVNHTTAPLGFFAYRNPVPSRDPLLPGAGLHRATTSRSWATGAPVRPWPRRAWCRRPGPRPGPAASSTC